MSISTGSGVGGSIGGPQQLTPQEIEASAWAVVNRERLGIVKDTVEIPFTQVGGNVWKYNTDSSRPTLMPMGTSRTMAGEEPKTDESWKGSYEQLLDKLPPGMKARLLREQGKAAEARSQDYTTLDKQLTQVAKGLTWMEKAGRPLDAQTPEGERTLHNQSLPGRALKGMVEQSQAELAGAENFLNDVGPNDPYHDKLRYFTNKSSDLQSRMNTLLETLKDPKAEIPSQKQMDGLCKDIGKLLQEFNAVSQGNNLQMMGPMLEAMEAVAQAMSMTPTTPSLFLGLKTALKGIFKSDSAAGLIGENLEALLNALQSGLAATLMKKLGAAKLKMLMMMFMSALGGAVLFSDEESPKHYNDEDGEERERQKFDFLLMMEWLESSEAIQQLFTIIAKACGLNDSEQNSTAKLLELPMLLWMVLAAGKAKEEKTAPLLNEMMIPLEKKLLEVERIINTAQPVDEASSANRKNLSIFLQQALMASQNYESEGLFQVLEAYIEQFTGSNEGFAKDLKEIKDVLKLFKHALGSGLDNETKATTAMIQAA